MLVQSGVKWVTSMDVKLQWSVDTEVIEESFDLMTCAWDGSDTEIELNEKG
jgi:hypothetical protein